MEESYGTQFGRRNFNESPLQKYSSFHKILYSLRKNYDGNESKEDEHGHHCARRLKHPKLDITNDHSIHPRDDAE
jgi:hypothetical protein